ncbi:MAG: phospholipase D-like domain-containing protein [Pseudomonadota bacterium]|nr:phospholipase D-like domain-containing protein [Pseudomonadota bacterium]
MGDQTPFTEFLALAQELTTARLLCDAYVQGVWNAELDQSGLLAVCHLPISQAPALLQTLRLGIAAGIFVAESERTWRVVLPRSDMVALSTLLAGATLYRDNVHRDDNIVRVVMTHPMPSTRLWQQLASMGGRGASIVDTDSCFHSIALNARRRFVVASPFIDAHGAQFLANLFSRTASDVERILITRVTDEILGNFRLDEPTAPQLLDYRNDTDSSEYETFHAKVLLADQQSCYIGSANLNWASLRKTVELGVWVEGSAAQEVASIVDGMVLASRRINWT